MQAERQRRWYENLSWEQREARRIRQRAAARIENMTAEQIEKKHRRNARRLFVSGMYLGMCGFTEREMEEMLTNAERMEV